MENVCDGKENHMQNPVARWGKILPSVLWEILLGYYWPEVYLMFSVSYKPQSDGPSGRAV
jgi:hypothetical protein